MGKVGFDSDLGAIFQKKVAKDEQAAKDQGEKKQPKKKESAAPVEKKETESVTIRISKEEKHAFKAYCARRGVNMSDALAELVRECLKNE